MYIKITKNRITVKSFLLLSMSLFVFSGCSYQENKNNEDNPVNTTHVERPDLTENVLTKTDGTEVTLQSTSTQSVKNKNAKIYTNQIFENVKESTLIIESGITEITGYIKESVVTVKKGAVLKTPYVKNSKIIVEKGGDLQVLSRLKESEIQLFDEENFSVRPADIDEDSHIKQL